MGISFTGSIVPHGSFKVKTNTPPIWITPSGLIGAANGGQNFTHVLQAIDSENNQLTYALISGALPSGLELSGSSISGTPTNIPGTYSFTVRVSDSEVSVDRAFTIEVTNQTPIWQTTSGVQTSATEGIYYSLALQATDPNHDSVTYSVVSGAVPDGLSLNGATGVISGTPTVVGVANFTVRASDGVGGAVDRSFTISVTAAALNTATFDPSLTREYSPSLVTAIPTTQMSFSDGNKRIYRTTVPTVEIYANSTRGVRFDTEIVRGYFEMHIPVYSRYNMVGLMDHRFPTEFAYSKNRFLFRNNNGTHVLYTEACTSTQTALPFSDGAVLGFAYQTHPTIASERRVWMRVNGTWVASGNPAQNSTPFAHSFLPGVTFAPYCLMHTSSTGTGWTTGLDVRLRTALADLSHTPPTGFLVGLP